MIKIDFTILDPMGNLTALVGTKTPKSRRSIVAKMIMNKYPRIEQVGFTSNDTLEMMGGELSINGTLATGYYLALNKTPPTSLRGVKRRSNLINTTRLLRFARNDESAKFSISGVSRKAKYFLKKNLPTISLTIPYKTIKIDGFDFVDLGGIGYFVVDSGQARMTDINCLLLFEKFRKKFEKSLNRNAWGVVFFQKNRIWPVVYIKDRQGKTLEKRLEMACGSGSLAYSLIPGKEKIIQPSGEMIKIKKKRDKFEISGRVKILAS